jgi:hypothetical protein
MVKYEQLWDTLYYDELFIARREAGGKPGIKAPGRERGVKGSGPDGPV